MLNLKFFLGLALLLNGSILNNDDVVITGKAENMKEGAAVVSNQGKGTFFLEGKDSWSDKDYHKTVKVWGKLLLEESKELSPDLPVRQQTTGIKRTILKPKWKFVK